MRRSALLTAALAATCLAQPGLARADAPANDGPAGAIAFSAQTAENGTPTEKQGLADLTSATADPGVAPCLGSASFARTVWYRVPAASTVRTISVTGTSGSGGSAAQPDIAAFVVPAGSSAPVEPQSCDGGEVEPTIPGGDVGGAPKVDVRVAAGQDVLVQVGRPAGQVAESVVLSESEIAQPATPAPAGDVAGADTGVLKLRTTAKVALGGATVSGEDPAEPACPASATVWRRFTAKVSGSQQVHVSGAAVTAVTAFVGDRPTADGAVSCTQRQGDGTIALGVPAKRGQQVWVRIGTETSAAAATAAVRVLSPQATKLSVSLVDRRRKVRLRVTGASVRSVRVTVQRRVNRKYRTVATASLSTLSLGKSRTVSVRRKGVLTRSGRYRFLVRAVTSTSPAKRVTLSRTSLLRRL